MPVLGAATKAVIKRHLPRGLNVGPAVVQLFLNDGRSTRLGLVNFPSFLAPTCAIDYRYALRAYDESGRPERDRRECANDGGHGPRIRLGTTRDDGHQRDRKRAQPDAGADAEPESDSRPGANPQSHSKPESTSASDAAGAYRSVTR